MAMRFVLDDGDGSQRQLYASDDEKATLEGTT